MSTIVFVHAHPDDEASQTSGSMTRLSAEGHRVVVVYGTGGDHGTIPDGHDGDLAELRRAEAAASAEVTGAQRLVWLDHLDVLDGEDGNADITKKSDFVTISWTKFRYTDKSYPSGTSGKSHRFSNLLGGSDNADKEGADWAEVARIVLHRDPAFDPARTRHCWEDHLRRARWMTETGYRRILTQQWDTLQ